MLTSPRAVAVSIEIVRAFVRLRSAASLGEPLARRIDALERRYDSQFRQVFDAIRLLMTEQVKVKAKLTRGPATAPRRRIGFRPSGNRTR